MQDTKARPIVGARGFREASLGYLFIAPAMLVILAIAVYPLLTTFWLSLHQKNLKIPWLGEGFVGLNNYAQLLGDDRFWSAFMHTVFFTVVSVGLELVLGLGIALAINQAFTARGLTRTAILVPWSIPTVVAAVIWLFMIHPTSGIIVDLLHWLGMAGPATVLLARPATAWATIIATDVWKTTPFMALLLLAGLQTIPKDLYEAAAVDGVSAWRRFSAITLPLLKPTILVALIFRTLQAFLVFGHIYTMTRGGPGTATETLAFLAYQAILNDMDFGYGSAISVVIFLCILAFAILYIRWLGLGLEKGQKE